MALNPLAKHVADIQQKLVVPQSIGFHERLSILIDRKRGIIVMDKVPNCPNMIG
ncbi:hypothetical protein CCP3SC5AM1_1610001 [Gammaproteobacteria bacterium]